MQLATEVFGQVIVVHTPEELGAEQAPQFENFISQLERRHAVLDIDDTESLDSLGLTALLVARDHLREQGGDLRIATSNATNRKILEITRLDCELEVFESVIDAVKSFQ